MSWWLPLQKGYWISSHIYVLLNCFPSSTTHHFCKDHAEHYWIGLARHTTHHDVSQTEFKITLHLVPSHCMAKEKKIKIKKSHLLWLPIPLRNSYWVDLLFQVTNSPSFAVLNNLGGVTPFYNRITPSSSLFLITTYKLKLNLLCFSPACKRKMCSDSSTQNNMLNFRN